jgi:hypothetical protein
VEVLMRGYIRKEAYVDDEKAPFGKRYDVWFADKEHAMHWDTIEEAKSAVKFFEGKRIEISLSDGGKRVCTGFEIEERKPGEFVIFCDTPFNAPTRS